MQQDEDQLAAFGEFVRAQRRLAQVSQRNLARMSGVSDSYLSQIERGNYRPSPQVVKALAQGYGGKIRAALENALKIQAKHADAHIAMGAYHAEIIDKVGALVGGLTYGANKDKGEEHYRKALKLAPDSPIAHIEMANGLVLMHGKKMLEEAGKLYAKAAGMTPRDAMEKLDVEAARAELE